MMIDCIIVSPTTGCTTSSSLFIKNIPTIRKNKTMLETRPRTDTVAITRTFDGVEAATHRVIEQVGGMESVIRGAKIAILKPNLVAGRNAATGSTTNFDLMKAVAEEVRACVAEPV